MQVFSVTFSFSIVEEKEIEKILRNLSEKKACQKFDISLRIIKENTDVCTNLLTSSFNEAIAFSQFPSTMKLADIIPVFMKDDRNLKSTDRLISILSNFSKVFEETIHDPFSFFSMFSQNTSVALENALVPNIAVLQ